MKKILLALAVCIGTTFVCDNLVAQCTGGVRPDIYSLSPAQRVELRDAIMDFLTDGVDQSDPNVNSPEDYPQVAHHTGHLNAVHFTETIKFLTWHRWFVSSLEHWLLEHGHGNFVPLPAWNPTTPIPAEFFNNTLAKLPNADGFPNLVDATPSGFNFALVTGSNKCTLFSDPDDFADAVENEHNWVHNNIGGTMAGLFTSPGAAIFWIWHAWVDDVWYCYQKDCMNLTSSDIYVRDDINDNGIEPSNAAINWISPDIWVRKTNDGFVNKESQDLFQTPGAKAFVYIRVWNRGGERHPDGQGTIEAYWANASAGLSWPFPWNGLPVPGLCQPPNADLPLGGPVGSKPLRSVNEDFIDFTHSNLVRQDFTIYEFEWTLPDPDKYKFCFNDEEWQHRHFCILARIIDDDADPIVDNGNFRDYLNNNNDVALKNITIFGDGQQIVPSDEECLFFGNYTNQPMNDVKLRMVFPTETDQQLLQKAEIRLFPDGATQQEWQQNGMQGTGANLDATGGIRLNAPNAEIRGIPLYPFEIHRFCLKITPLLNTDQKFAFDIIQYNGDQIINGERYQVGLNAIERDMRLNPQQGEVPNNLTDASFSVYPNPATDQLMLVWNGKTMEKQIEMSDQLGRVIFSTNSSDGQYSMDLTNVPKGFYFVRLTDKLTRVSTTQKVIIE